MTTHFCRCLADRIEVERLSRRLRNNSAATRAALKSRHIGGEVSDDQVNPAPHSLQEGGTGAVASLALAARPGPVLTLHRSAQDAQNRCGDRVAYATAVFSGADIHSIMRSVFNRPVKPCQFE